MTERRPSLDEALELVAALERHCQQLRLIGQDDIQPIVAEIAALLGEIRSDLDPDTDCSR